MKVSLRCFCVIVSLLPAVLCFEPISTSIYIGLSAFGAFGGIKYYDQIWEKTYCQFSECCIPKNLPVDIMSLHANMTSRLYGQHIVEEKVFQAVASHYKEIEKSQKPLVMSFHGTPGTGKNYVSNMIADAVFEKGVNSQFYHVFHGTQYSDSDRLERYKREIKTQIFDAIKLCPYSIFVFDEVDKMPAGIFEGITALLDHHALVRGADFKKAIFIFLTNYGGAEITKVLHQLMTKKGLYRHETKLSHFEDINKIGIYNRPGGMKDSRLITSAIIDFYVPFLPLEEKHIVQCIKAEYENFGKSYVNQEMIDEILAYIGFEPIMKFANTGCKTIHKKVKTECL